MENSYSGEPFRGRLLRLAAYHETVPGKRFDFSSWVGKDWGGAPDLSCGTTACGLGHATTIPEFRYLGLVLVDFRAKHDEVQYLTTGVPALAEEDPDSVFRDPRRATCRATAEIFGLDRNETEYLFTPRDCSGDCAYEADGETCPDLRLSGKASPQELAAHIRDFVEHGCPDFIAH
jgi:hypothetical protein